MIAVLRALSLILLATLILSIALALAMGAGAGANAAEVSLFAPLAVVIFFTVPAVTLFLWTSRKGRQVQDLAERARRSLASGESKPISTRPYDEDIAQLARLMEEWRQLILDQRERIGSLERIRGRILDGIGDGVLAIDREKNIVLANRRFLDLIGASDPFIGSPYYRLIRQTAIQSALDRALDGEPASELISIASGASERKVNVHAFPLEQESEAAAVAIFIDVTRIFQLERIRRDFLSDFSHEVRTPLAGVRSAVETLETSDLAPQQQEQLWGVVSRQLSRLERLVNDLSELNRIESGDLDLVTAEIELNALLKDVAEEFRDRAAARKVVVAVSSEAPVRASVDPQRIQQIVANLIDNAIKFSSRGGTVDVRCIDRGSSVQIEVSDQGEGIPASELSRIFHRFYRLDRSRSQEVPGTGLGLAIAKHLVALHAGTIEVESEPGRGTTFRVILPVSPGREREEL